MKKAYSLDYGIERDVDRLKAVEEILATLEKRPTSKELEQMADYLMYGRDENGKNAIQRGETTDSDKRYNSFTRLADKFESLDKILDNPLSDHSALKSLDQRYIYFRKKPQFSRKEPGIAEIPGMKELWEAIDAKAAEIEDLEKSGTTIRDSYRLYQKKHQLIDMRRHQYYLKDAYKPTLHFLNLTPPSPQTVNFDSDSAYWCNESEMRANFEKDKFLKSHSHNLQDYESRENPITGETEYRWVVRRQVFDWEDSNHIYQLIRFYSEIYMASYDKYDSWGRTLIYDFDRYFDMCHFSEELTYILMRRIDKATLEEISEEVKEKFNLNWDPSRISLIASRDIPTRMANEIKRYHIICATPEEEKKECPRCGRRLPLTSLFFIRNKWRNDGFSKYCKECDRESRIRRGIQSNDRIKFKDPLMY